MTTRKFCTITVSSHNFLMCERCLRVKSVSQLITKIILAQNAKWKSAFALSFSFPFAIIIGFNILEELGDRSKNWWLSPIFCYLNYSCDQGAFPMFCLLLDTGIMLERLGGTCHNILKFYLKRSSARRNSKIINVSWFSCLWRIFLIFIYLIEESNFWEDRTFAHNRCVFIICTFIIALFYSCAESTYLITSCDSPSLIMSARLG